MLRKDLSNCHEVRHVEQRHSAHVKQSHCVGKQSRLPTVRITVLVRDLPFYILASTAATVAPIAAGVGQIITPNSFSIATFSAALSPTDEIIAPA